jgi:hypothetical protein
MSVVSSTNKTDRHDITEIFVKSGVKHHNPTPNSNVWVFFLDPTAFDSQDYITSILYFQF